MALGQRPLMWWGIVLQVAKWAARLPIAALVIVAAALFSWLGLFFLWRASWWIYEHWLQNPW